MDIFHVHWGTSGNSGAYIDEIYQALNACGFSQEVFVSYYYPFPYGNKIFFKNSDIYINKWQGKKRIFFLAIDTIYALCFLFLKALTKRPQIINYSMVSGCYTFLVYYLKLLKLFSGSRLIITCHDVMPFGSDEKKYQMEIRNRKKVFGFADILLVHNLNSQKILEDYFEINKDKIFYHRFPIQDLVKLHKVLPCEKKYDFLFIGHLRKEKGIEFLLNCWKKFHQSYPHATLCIAGRDISNLCNPKLFIDDNIVFKLHFVSDEEFVDLVNKSRIVVLPYFEGTNSGIASDVLSLGAEIITSDLPMFKENLLIDNSCMYKVGDAESLLQLMIRKYNCKNHCDGRVKIDEYKSGFNKELEKIYKNIIYDYKK